MKEEEELGMKNHFLKGLQGKRSRRICAVILAACMLFSAAGCSQETAGAQDQTGTESAVSDSAAGDGTESAADSGTAVSEEAEASGEITIWTKDEAISNYDEYLSEKLPDLKINYVVMDDSTIRTKLKAVMSSGATPPDVVLVEIGMWKELMNLPMWEDLSAAPFDAAGLLEEHYGYIQELSKNEEGTIVGLTNQATPAGYFYRRSIATEVFGTDDPDEISAMLTDWDSVMETGRTVYEKAGISLFPSIDDIIRIQSDISPEPWIADGQFIINENVTKALELAKEADETHVAGRLEQWGPEWRENFNTAEYSMGLFSATWLMAYDIKSGAPETEGDWGFAKMIEDQFYGGSFFAVPLGAPNKEGAWEYIKTVTGDHDFLDFYSNEIGDFSSNQVFNEELAKVKTSDSWWGGQNIIQTFNDVAADAEARAMYDYQGDAIYAVTEAAREYVYNGKTMEEAIQVIVDIMAADVPDVEVIVE